MHASRAAIASGLLAAATCLAFVAPDEPAAVAAAQRALLALQDADGGWALHELRLEPDARTSVWLRADRALATRTALAALERGPQSDASRAAQDRARVWLARRATPATPPPRDPHAALGTRLHALRDAIALAERQPGRLAEEALLAALDASFRTRLAAERAAARAPELRASLGLAELELTERLSRAVELLSPAHAARYRSRLRDEVLAALSDDGRVRDPLRARGVSSLATARALLVLRRDLARDA